MGARSLVETEVYRFLRSAEPEVLCIQGRWGVGKTFLWNKVVEATLEDSSYKLARYAYVSLFGINSLEALKLTIFENSEFVVKGDQTPGGRVLKAGARLVRQSQQYAKLLKTIPVIGGAVDGLSPLFFQSVRDEVICFDDLERRSKGLSIAEVLGLISFLREQRNCKVALLLNDAKLSTTDRGEFDAYFEKVVDATLTFAPTAAQAAEIAIEGRSKSRRRLAKHIERLGIANIRVIRKIVRAVDHVKPALKAFDSKVLEQAEQSIALLGWSVYQTEEAPPLSFIERWNTYSDLLGDQKRLSPDDERWSAILRSYGFTSCDEFDLCLLDGIRTGVFDLTRIKSLGADLDKAAKANAQSGSVSKAWEAYRHSFDDDSEDVISGLVSAARENIYIMPANRFDSIVSLVRKLRGNNEADNLVDFYMDCHNSEGRQFYATGRNHALESMTDPVLLARFKEKFDSLIPVLNMDNVMREYTKVDILDERRCDFLSKQSVEQFVSFFKKTKGDYLSDAVNACLSSDRITNASDEERLISKKTKEALAIIGKENPLNAERVKTLYRVDVT